MWYANNYFQNNKIVFRVLDDDSLEAASAEDWLPY